MGLRIPASPPWMLLLTAASTASETVTLMAQQSGSHAVPTQNGTAPLTPVRVRICVKASSFSDFTHPLLTASRDCHRAGRTRRALCALQKASLQLLLPSIFMRLKNQQSLGVKRFGYGSAAVGQGTLQ